MSSALPATVRAAEDALAEHLARRELLIIAGAGIAVGAETPLLDAQAVIERLQDYLPDDLPQAAADGLDPLDVAQWYAEEHGHQHLEMRLTRAYELAGQAPSPLQSALMSLPVHVIFTVSYDQALEHALAAAGAFPEVIVDELHMVRIDDLMAVNVVKLFGCVSMPDSLVLTREDHERYVETHQALIAFLRVQLATRTVLFAGFDFADPRLRAIHTVIRQTLRAHRRRAFALDLAPLQPLLTRQWNRHGVDFIPLPDVPAMIAFVERLAARVGTAERGDDLLTRVQELHGDEASPALSSAADVARKIEALRGQIRGLLREAARHPDLALDARLRDVERGEPGSAAGLSALQTLFQLGQVMESMGRGLEGHEWRRLGNALYRHRDWPLAIRAYSAAIKVAHGSDPWTEGNLARAYLRLGHYARAEGLLRRLVFVRSPDDQALDTPWLVHRPTDLTELGHAVLQRARQLRDEGKLEQAFSALKEMRPWLHKGMGAPWMMAAIQPDRQRAKMNIKAPVTSHHPALLTCFAANYRLAYELSVLLRQFREAERCRSQAVRLLVQAVQEAPALVEAREHLIEIYYENLLQRPTAETNLRLNIEQIEELAAMSEHGRSMRDALRTRYASAWRRAGR